MTDLIGLKPGKCTAEENGKPKATAAAAAVAFGFYFYHCHFFFKLRSPLGLLPQELFPEFLLLLKKLPAA